VKPFLPSFWQKKQRKVEEKKSMFEYTTHGTCSRKIHFDIDGDKKLHNVSFEGGCNGNLKALGILTEGMDAAEAIKKLRGIDCGGRGTSCGDQFSKGIEAALAG
jgi:uncharacterized protein (TIGR03905 family)